jgi:hypothetical protein
MQTGCCRCGKAYRVLLDVFDGPRPENHLRGGLVKGLGLVQGNVLSLDNYFRLIEVYFQSKSVLNNFFPKNQCSKLKSLKWLPQSLRSGFGI